MKIAYVTLGNPYDKNSWSGTDYYTRKALEDVGNDVYPIIIPHAKKWDGLMRKIYSKLIGRNYIHERSIDFCKTSAKFVESHLQSGTEAIFVIGSLVVSQIHVDIPVFFYTDGVFSLTASMYKWCNLMPDFLIAQQAVIERQALVNATKAFVTSDRIVPEMVQKYAGDESKIKVVPLGANLDSVPTRHEIDEIIAARSEQNVLNILYVGVDWVRKGGAKVLSTCSLIQKRGVTVKCHLVGCKNAPENLPDFVVDHGFLSKNNPKEYQELFDLYRDCHFLFVPSLGECYGLVFCEASAFALPSISTNVGGIPTVVKNGKNGYLFDLDEREDTIADVMISVFSDKEKYVKLCASSRAEYESRLNWEVAGRSLSDYMKS